MLDTPDLQDFSEDTRGNLTAVDSSVDSAVMVIDAANGTEERGHWLSAELAL